MEENKTNMERLLESIDARMARMEEMTAIGAKSVLTVPEAAVYLGISEGWLRHKMSDDLISYHKGAGDNRTYIAKRDLDAYMTGVKYKSDAEIKEEVDAHYLMMRRERRDKEAAKRKRV